jgi:hypothetical protein
MSSVPLALHGEILRMSAEAARLSPDMRSDHRLILDLTDLQTAQRNIALAIRNIEHERAIRAHKDAQ